MSRKASAKHGYDPEVEHERQARGDSEGTPVTITFSSSTTAYVRHGLGRLPRGADQIRVNFQEPISMVTDAFIVAVGLDPTVWTAFVRATSASGTATARIF